MDVFFYPLLFALGFLVGCWFYRWMLKRDPARLQNLVDLANKAGARVKDAVNKD